MFLMGTLGRRDVWPTGDYGVRAGFALAFGHDEMPSPKELELLGDRFRPHRSVVAWYCWRAVDDQAGAWVAADRVSSVVSVMVTRLCAATLLLPPLLLCR